MTGCGLSLVSEPWLARQAIHATWYSRASKIDICVRSSTPVCLLIAPRQGYGRESRREMTDGRTGNDVPGTRYDKHCCTRYTRYDTAVISYQAPGIHQLNWQNMRNANQSTCVAKLKNQTKQKSRLQHAVLEKARSSSCIGSWPLIS